jgi:hypothetical protein
LHTLAERKREVLEVSQGIPNACSNPAGSRNRGLLSLMRRHADKLSRAQKANWRSTLNTTQRQTSSTSSGNRSASYCCCGSAPHEPCRRLAPALLTHFQQLRTWGFAPLQSLGETLDSCGKRRSRACGFTRNNGITEGFHTKMEVLQRQAYGLRNFNNYRMRVVVMCS